MTIENLKQSVASALHNQTINNYSVADACRIGGFCRATLYNLWANGAGPRKFKLGKRTLIRARDFHQWISELAGA